MNELDPTNQTPKDNIREERQQIITPRRLGELFVPRGHTVYSVDLTTGEVKEAEYEKTGTYDAERQTIVKGKVKYDPNLILFTALNMKNAKRKIANEIKNINA